MIQGSLAVTRDRFSFSYDATGEFLLESPRGQLRLKCQCAVSRPDCPDFGLTWKPGELAENDDCVQWRFHASETIWHRKELIVTITGEEILFHVEVEGEGAIDRVVFFAGYPPEQAVEPRGTLANLTWARLQWHRNWAGSPATFRNVLNAQPNGLHEQTLDAGVSQRISCAATFGPELFNTFFAPPLYAYVLDEAFSVGLVAPLGQSRFNHFDYTAARGWGIELHYDGMTKVSGPWQSPAIRIAPGEGADTLLAGYVKFLHTRGLAPRTPPSTPEWALRPMICGWGQQTAWANLAAAGAVPTVGSPIIPGGGGYATQAAYEEIVRLIDERGLPWGTLTIDMGWAKCLTIPRVDTGTWPDMKGFIERLHRRGKRVFLWLATWNPGGLDPALRMPHDPGLTDCCDPTNPEFRRQLTDSVTEMISPHGLNADGIKLDFTGDVPRGRGFRPASEDLWGLDLVHDYVQLIHTAMKSAREDAILETQCANPQFGPVTEMIRLNDLFSPREEVRPMMKFRARIARLALPGWPIDTDNDPFVTREAWLDYLRFQPQIGIPSLYTLTHMSFAKAGAGPEEIPMQDWAEIRAIWEEYLQHRA